MGMVRRAKSKPANHEAESAYFTGEGGAAGNMMKFSEICAPPRLSNLKRITQIEETLRMSVSI